MKRAPRVFKGTCCISGCDEVVSGARGMCSRHYARWRRNGHPRLTNGRGCIDPAERLALQSKRSKNGCLEWTGSISKRGYGQTMWRYKFFSAHRLAWTLSNGDIPDGMWVLHKCDNPKCIEVSHLFLGSPSDNRRDCLDKGRGNLKSGEDHHQYKHGRYVGVTARRKAREASRRRVIV